jgi:hypothetical protein
MATKLSRQALNTLHILRHAEQQGVPVATSVGTTARWQDIFCGCYWVSGPSARGLERKGLAEVYPSPSEVPSRSCARLTDEGRRRAEEAAS